MRRRSTICWISPGNMTRWRKKEAMTERATAKPTAMPNLTDIPGDPILTPFLSKCGLSWIKALMPGRRDNRTGSSWRTGHDGWLLAWVGNAVRRAFLAVGAGPDSGGALPRTGNREDGYTGAGRPRAAL